MSTSSQLHRVSSVLIVVATLQAAGLVAAVAQQDQKTAAAPAIESQTLAGATAGPAVAMTLGTIPAPSTTAPSSTTTMAPPATTDAPAPAPAPASRRAAPAPPAPPASAPPAPAPAPQPAPTAAPAPSAIERVRAAYPSAVPAAWRDAIAVTLEIVDGNVSWANPDGRIMVSEAHATGPDARLRALLAHEFGHLIAFRYGSHAYNGAAPEGWPEYSSRPEEAWADCVATAFTGIVEPSHGLPPCTGESLSWADHWLDQGPPW